MVCTTPIVRSGARGPRACCRSRCRAEGVVWCPVNSRKAFTLKVKPSQVRSAQSRALAGEGMA